MQETVIDDALAVSIEAGEDGTEISDVHKQAADWLLLLVEAPLDMNCQLIDRHGTKVPGLHIQGVPMAGIAQSEASLNLELMKESP